MSDYVKKRVVELFGEGKFFCAETTLKVIAEAGGKENDDLIRMTTGLCSGVARTCGTCGAVNGAILGIGLYTGRAHAGEEHDPNYALVQEFLDRFESEFESINCLELTGCDFGTLEGQEKFKKDKLLHQCHCYAVFAVETALALLREHEYLPEFHDFIKSRLAPCGLSCGKCLAYAGGPIQELSLSLADQLGENFESYAKRFEAMNPVFKKYSQFRELLDFFATGTCSGCREKGCLFKDCNVTRCVKEQGVDYCFECEQFPCDHNGMPGPLAERWRENNEKMRALGPEAWFDGCKIRTRYP